MNGCVQSVRKMPTIKKHLIICRDHGSGSQLNPVEPAGLNLHSSLDCLNGRSISLETSEKSPFYLFIGKELNPNLLNCCHLSRFKSTTNLSNHSTMNVILTIVLGNKKLFTV